MPTVKGDIFVDHSEIDQIGKQIQVAQQHEKIRLLLIR